MRLGVFGGSFDPPHVGHLAVAQDAVETLALDVMLLVPARVSPFKSGAETTPGAVRAGLLERALAGHPALRIWRGELERPGPSYTADTLAEIRETFPGAEIFLLMGDDQWRSFPEWRNPRQILEAATVCVLTRGDRPEDTEAADWPHRRVQSRRVDVSSSEVRRRVAEGRSIRFLVPESVREAIIENRLYGTRDAALSAPGPGTS